MRPARPAVMNLYGAGNPSSNYGSAALDLSMPISLSPPPASPSPPVSSYGMDTSSFGDYNLATSLSNAYVGSGFYGSPALGTQSSLPVAFSSNAFKTSLGSSLQNSPYGSLSEGDTESLLSAYSQLNSGSLPSGLDGASVTAPSYKTAASRLIPRIVKAPFKKIHKIFSRKGRFFG